jgi:hypothetical protein
MINSKINERLELLKTENELQLLKNTMDIPFVMEVLTQMETDAKIEPSSIRSTVLDFSNVLRYNLYETAQKDISIYRELEVLKEQLHLHATIHHCEIKVPDYGEKDFTILPGLILKTVSEYLKINPFGGRLQLISMGDKVVFQITDESNLNLNRLKEKLYFLFSSATGVTVENSHFKLKLN